MVPCRRMQSVNDARCLVWQMRPVKVAPTLQRRTQPSMDEILRCGICFEYFNIAMMIPHCSHNYCSLCVRKFLSYKTQCPICCVTVTEPELLNNRVLDELVKCFRTARELLSKCDLQSPPVSPQAAQAADISNRNQSSGFKAHAKMKREMKYMDRFLSQSHSSIRPSGVQSTEKQCEEEQSDTYTQSITANCLADLAQKDNDAEPSTSGLKEIVKVDCPVCAVAIPEKNINRHLDSCLTQEDKKESLRSSVNKRKLLPKLVYNLLSDRDLKKKLKECGLSTQGSKAQLVKRHQEFIQMYNSQCDSLNPKSAKDIAKEIEKNEKTRAQLETKMVENALKFTKDQSEEEINVIHKEYREKHKEQFQQLITEVRNRWKSKGKKLKSEHDKETEEQCLTIREVDITECQNMDCNTEEACQDEPQLPEITGSLVTSDTLKPESCSFDVVLPSSLSTSRQLSKVSTGKRKMREPFRKRSSENKRARM
ncbi:E3 ubiquitin-protein ligase RAD18 isoform X2 [Pristis pectinata]|uniref:E3 ubiquitin-protein ligase RAD18 isoform X2 n=1 Tax=Pristis pectinata TaxID=685728 RepID=UPI00223D46D4|nr:E3 ubiquitin-protein ligase RAD18 isoform X2 [Pristis pectinata]